MNTLDDITREQPAAPADEEEKKRKKKRNLLVGLAALAVIGGSAVCLSTGIVDKLKPAPEPQPTETVAVRVEPTNTAYAPLETAVTLSPTPTTPVEAYDIREAWYGFYRGTANGDRTDLDTGDLSTGDTRGFVNTAFWLEIVGKDECLGYQPPFCDENTSWGIDIAYMWGNPEVPFAEIQVYLPADLSEASNLTLTESRLVITPSEEQPYELVIEKVNDRLQGYLRTEGRVLYQWDEDAAWIPNTAEFIADRVAPTYDNHPAND